MKAAYNCHTFLHLLPIAGIRIICAIVILRDLISGIPVKINDLLRNTESGYHIIYCLFLSPVNEKFRSRPGNSADIVAVLYLK